MKTAIFADTLNYEKFVNIAPSLAESGLNLQWICSGSLLVDKAVEPYANEAMLSLSSCVKDKNVSFDGLEELEKNCPLTVSALIQSDPLLYALDRAAGYTYASAVFRTVKEFIEQYKSEAIVVFPDNATAFIVAAAFRAMSKKVLVPYRDRAITRKYVFFRDEMLTNIISSGADSAIGLKSKKVVDKLIGDLTMHFEEDKRVTSLYSSTTLKSLFRKAINSMRYKSYDMTEAGFTRFFERTIFTHKQAGLMRRRGMVKDNGMLPDSGYGVFLLQPQPYPELDMRCTFSNDLFKHISDISKLLPSDKLLVVRETAAAEGDRVRDFYDAVKELPNTLMASPEADLNYMIRNADFVSGVCDPGLYRAAIFGTPAITFADSPYNALSQVIHCQTHKHIKQALEYAFKKDIKMPASASQEDEDFIKRLVNSAWNTDSSELTSEALRNALYKC